MKRLAAAAALALLVLALATLRREPELVAFAPRAPTTSRAEAPVLPVASTPEARPLVDPEPAPQLVETPAAPVARPTSWTLVTVDAQDAPVAGARVEIWRDDEALAAGEPPSATHWTDALGRVSLVLPSWRAVLLAFHPEAGSSGVWDRGTLSGRGALTASQESVLSLLPLARVEGRVRGADGSPAPLAILHRWAGRYGEDGRRARPAPPLRLEADGRFTLELDAAAPVVLHAEQGELRTPPLPLLPEAGSTSAVELAFPGAWGLVGRVVDAAGAAVPGALVTLWNEATAEQTSDAAGGFGFELAGAGSAELLASAPGHAPSDLVSVELTEARPRLEVLLHLPPPAELAGRVLLDDEPVAGARVYAQPSFDLGPRAWEIFGTASATSGERGEFVLVPLRPDGRYDLIAYPWPEEPALSVRRSSFTPGTEALVAAESREKQRVRQRVEVVAADGRPVTDVRLALARRGEGSFGARRLARDEGGRYEAEDLVPDLQYALLVEAEGYGPARSPWFLAAADAPLVRVELHRSGRAELELVDAAGAPAAFALCRVEPVAPASDLPPAWSVFRFEVPLRADAQGRVILAPIDAGRYALHVEHGAAPVHVAEIDVAESLTTRVRVALPR